MRPDTHRKYMRYANMVQRGKSVKDTARHYRVSPSVISKACDHCNVIRSRKQGESAFSGRTWKVIAAIVNGNNTYANIGNQLGVTSAYVRMTAARLRKAGCRAIQPRRPGLTAQGTDNKN